MNFNEMNGSMVLQLHLSKEYAMTFICEKYTINEMEKIIRYTDYIIFDSLILPLCIDTHEYVFSIISNCVTITEISLHLLICMSKTEIIGNKMIVIIEPSSIFYKEFILPIRALPYSEITVYVGNKNVNNNIKYKMLYKGVEFNNNEIKKIYDKFITIQKFSYNTAKIKDNKIKQEINNFTGFFVISDCELKNVKIYCDNSMYFEYNKYVINRQLIKKRIYWSNNHMNVVRDLLKKKGVTWGVINMILDYCKPDVCTEYVYWIGLKNNTFNENCSTLIKSKATLDVHVESVTNTRVNGYIYTRSVDELVMHSGIIVNK